MDNLTEFYGSLFCFLHFIICLTQIIFQCYLTLFLFIYYFYPKVFLCFAVKVSKPHYLSNSKTKFFQFFYINKGFSPKEKNLILSKKFIFLLKFPCVLSLMLVSLTHSSKFLVPKEIYYVSSY